MSRPFDAATTLASASAIAIASLASAGCVMTFNGIETGPAARVGHDTEGGGQVAAYTSVGRASRDGTTDSIGATAIARGTFTSSSQSVAFGPGAFVAFGRSDKFLIARGGAHLFIERADGATLAGAGPHLSAALAYEIGGGRDGAMQVGPVGIRRRDQLLLTVGPAFQLDARFTRPDVAGVVSLNVGLAWWTDR